MAYAEEHRSKHTSTAKTESHLRLQWPPLEKDDAIFYALLRMGHECTHAIIPHPNPLSKKIENAWLIEVEHGHNDLGKHGQYTFCYKIVDDPKTAVGECRKGLNDLT